MRPVVRPVVPTRAAAALPRTAAVPIRTSAVVPDAIPTVVTGWASRTKAIRWRLVLPRDGARHARVAAVERAVDIHTAADTSRRFASRSRDVATRCLVVLTDGQHDVTGGRGGSLARRKGDGSTRAAGCDARAEHKRARNSLGRGSRFKHDGAT